MKDSSILTDFVKVRYITENNILNTVFSVNTDDFYTSIILEKCNAGVFRDWTRNFHSLLDEEMTEEEYNKIIDCIGEYVECTNKMFPNSILFVDKRRLPME